jgi:hypothetical protein
MQFVRVASTEEVLAANPEDEATRDIVRTRTPFGIWLFDGPDLGTIGAQLPGGKIGTVSALFAEWTEWLGSSDPQARWSAALHSGFVHLLRQGQVFAVRPIVLGEAMQLHDGRHRLFAAFEYLRELGNGRSLEVFWDRVRSPSRPPPSLIV